MQPISILLSLTGLANLAACQSISGKPDVSVRTFWMLKYCKKNGLTGQCGEDADFNAKTCGMLLLSDAPTAQS